MPLRHWYYGSEGIGKSSLAVAAPFPIMLDVENGSALLDVPRYPFSDGPRGHVPSSAEQIYGALAELRTLDHGYRTLIIDTVDALEPLLWARICEVDSRRKSQINKTGAILETIEDYGYGKGFNRALDEWRHLLGEIDRLRTERGMTVILVGHAVIKGYKNPEGEDYDRFQPALHHLASGLLKGWCDVVGYCCYEQGSKADDGQRAKGFATGRRMIRLERAAAWDAKTRIPMPAEIEMSISDPWRPIAMAIESGLHTTPADLLTQIGAELDRIGDDKLRTKVRAAVDERREDVAMLSRYLNRLKTMTPKEEA